ncbi:MAG TPA: TRAP transporter small permease [Pseudolabrys sp.]|nr:TRAP transporter small permease [Pseudolabrys sp.]
MAAHFRKAMDALYLICVVIAGTALVLISAVIPWGVYTRYVLNSAASWPEPTAVLLTIWLTFFGAAACYRLRFHMNVSFFVMLMSAFWQRFFDVLAEGAMVAMSIFMTVWGTKLVVATWDNSIADFPELSVGVTYLPIPLGGGILFLFVVERILCGPPPAPASHH